MKRGLFAIARRAFALLLCGAGILWFIGWDNEEKMQQNFWFDHAIHESLNMDCTSCHSGAREEAQTGIPSTRKCSFCHLDDNSHFPLPPELMKYIESGKEIPWIRLQRYPGHVYFTHSAHVKYGEMDCSQCHGVMKDRLEPTESFWSQPLDMEGCMDCHLEKQVSVDCLTCHK